MLLPLPANPTIPTRIRRFFLVYEGLQLSSRMALTGWPMSIVSHIRRTRRRRSGVLQARFEGIETRIELVERIRLELEMPESNPIKRIDDFTRDVGDWLGR